MPPERTGRFRGRDRLSKTVVSLGVLCVLVVAGAAFGVIQVLGRVATDLHRSAVALDALVVRVAAVEQDLGAISEDVYAIADDVGLIADSLADQEDDEAEDGEAVRLEQPSTARAARPAARAQRARSPVPRRARHEVVASRGVAHARRSAPPGPPANY